ncbi:hypothetical protein HPB50_005941 [Hyalomma asiaticum]|uniref:Uncharacterized protein n=1 Tax=Hyalomma asiaticum TaxID=266040 RepID=A0ACB7RLD3_HYAAI|nr:hypothetical protein HPB50_005941 [Hyalomma asiaticum]
MPEVCTSPTVDVSRKLSREQEKAARLERRREAARERARRRRADPETRARDAEYKRRRRAEDPEFRAREIASRLRYDEANRERNRLRQRRLRGPGHEPMFENFRRHQRASAAAADGGFRLDFLNVEPGRRVRILL